MHTTNAIAARHATPRTLEWGRKARKLEARHLRGTCRNAAIAEALAEMQEEDA